MTKRTQRFFSLAVLALSSALGCAGTTSGDDDDDAKGSGGKGAGGDSSGQGGESSGGDSGSAGQSGGDGGANNQGGQAGQPLSGGGGGNAGGGSAGSGSGGSASGGSGGTAGGGSGGSANGGSGGSVGTGGTPPMPTGNPVTDPPPSFTAVALDTTNIPKFKKYNVDTTADLDHIDGPLWLPGTGTMLVYQYAKNQMVIFNPTTQVVTPFNTTAPGVAAFDEKGSLITAGNGKLTRIKLSGEVIETLPSLFGGKASQPTDVIVRKDGNVYFTDGTNKAGRVLRVSPGGQVSQILAGGNPQGLILTLDHSALLVSDWDAKNITKFALNTDGSPKDAGSEWVVQNYLYSNGLCMDYAGNVFMVTHSGINVFTAAGQNMNRTAPPGPPAMPAGLPNFGNGLNCTFGGVDGKTLYVGGNLRVDGIISMYAIDFPNPGLP